jgi:hypothetical protein
MKIPSLLPGVAGEYFVAAELSRRGHIASISLRNTRGIDILATNRKASRSITIQCKTNQLNRKVWMLNDKSEDFVSDAHYYVFVALGDALVGPCYHIVPSHDVAVQTRNSHREWLGRLGRGGRQHIDNPVRKFVDPDDKYLERWDLLGLG